MFTSTVLSAPVLLNHINVSPAGACFRFSQTIGTLHFGWDPHLHLPLSILKRSSRAAFIADAFYVMLKQFLWWEFVLFQNAPTWERSPFPWQSSQLNVKPSRFTFVIFFVPATSAWGLSTATWSPGPTLATKIFIPSASILSSVVIGYRCIWKMG